VAQLVNGCSDLTVARAVCYKTVGGTLRIRSGDL
jgi:hypothetical protein